MTPSHSIQFSQLGLNSTLLKTLSNIGFDSPSAVQAKAIPVVLADKDVIVKAQTGTGKTAAFALPILQTLNPKNREPQALILAPTRELAMQVSDAFRQLGQDIKGLKVATLYGGGDYSTQDKALREGAQVIIGTTGRVMDHMRKGKLSIQSLKQVVLDEADEMLRMGFQEDVEWILSHTPKERQTTLFSATMPQGIKRIAKQYLVDPVEVNIQSQTEASTHIKQHFIDMPGAKKLPVLKRILEVLDYEGMIIFVRTKTATLEVADGLKTIGLKVEALNGDIPQNQRKQTVSNLKQGKTDIVVATDVAARGIDIPRLSYVINYDMPHDVETYIHRIGRTGRAGREGEAILFVKPHEKRMLAAIEKQTRNDILYMPIPKAKDINKQRCLRLIDSLNRIMSSSVEAPLKTTLIDFQKDSGASWEAIAFALSRKLDGRHGFLLNEKEDELSPSKPKKKNKTDTKRKSERPFKLSASKRRANKSPKATCRIEVGRKDGIKPRHILSTLSSIGKVQPDTIGHIDINKRYTTVELSAEEATRAQKKLKNTQLCGKDLQLSVL